MSAFWDILDLLSSPPGSLIYYLILLFCILAIVGLALSRWSRGERGSLVARLLLAGALMSFSRFLLIIVALLSRQGDFSPVRFTPPLERFVDALSVLLVCWALVFPHRYRIASRLTIGISALLTLVLYALSANSWTSILDANPLATYNGGSLQSRVWEFWQLVFLIPAFVYTLVNPARERDALNVGLGVLVVGHLLQLVYPLADRIDHLSAWTRFANLIAFPLFSVAVYQLIIQCFDAQALDLQAVNQESLAQLASMMSVIDTNLKLFASSDLDTVIRDGVQTISQVLQSDLCALMLAVPKASDGPLPDLLDPADPLRSLEPSDSPSPPEEMDLAIVYDATQLISNGPRVDVSAYPAIQQALAQHSPLILKDGPGSLDQPAANSELDRIFRLLGYDPVGPLLIQPLEHASTVTGSVLACRTQDQAPFAPSDFRKSEILAASLSTAIENARRHQRIQTRLEQLAAELDAAETRHTRLRADLENRLARSEEQATLYMQRLYEAELGEQQAQEDARQARRTLALMRQDSQTEVTRARDELKHSIRQAAYLTQQIANLDAQCLELGSLVQALEQEKGLLQLRLAVVATELDAPRTDSAEPTPAQTPPLAGSCSVTDTRSSTDRLSNAGLLAALTNDLSAPAASILKYTELFANSTAGRLEYKQSEILKRVQTNTERLQAMLNNLINLSVTDGNRPVLKLARVDMSKVIEVALSRCKFRLEEKDIKTRLEIGALPMPRVNPGYVQQILDNLVSHACRSARTGATINIRAYANDQAAGTRQLHVTISDTGPDLAAEKPDRTSELSRRTPDIHETGPGESRAELEIIKTLVEAHQGQIRCESNSGQAKFHLTIPIEPAPPPEHRGDASV